MKRKHRREYRRKCRWNYLRALAIAVVMAGLIAPGALCQIPGLPEVTDPFGGRGPMGADFNMMVTNGQFKKFDPEFKFHPDQELFPALVAERQATDYVTWSGKEMGKDFKWRPFPTSDKGYIYILSTGLQMLDDDETFAGSAPPEGMVYVPEGPFIMGSDVGDADESPKHTARTSAYFIDKLEVSNAEYKKVFPDFEFKPDRENFPAIVIWEQAAAYAAKVGKRLPTEAEWEKAARGTDGRTFPWGESFDASYISWDESVPRGGAPACPESPYGCVDMSGGAWEWTADWYKPYAGNEVPCEAYGEKYKVIRGGASFNDVAMNRTAHRYYLPPDITGNLYVGFRCAKDIE